MDAGWFYYRFLFNFLRSLLSHRFSME